ncbi:MAG: NIPSNAP family protein [Jiangellaceae bacterium]
MIDSDAVLEIRTYQLKPGAGTEFDRLFREEVRPLLDRFGTDVVWHGSSLDDPDSYALIRAFPSAEARDRDEDEFYGSDEWRHGPRERVLALIESYHTVVMAAGSEAADAVVVLRS